MRNDILWKKKEEKKRRWEIRCNELRNHENKRDRNGREIAKRRQIKNNEK